VNTFVAVAVGGALGAVSRYSFGLIGLAAVLIGDRIVDGELWRPLIIVGFLGAFTTFSAFSLDTLLLLQQGNYNTALAYILGSVTLCLGGTVSGMQLAKIFA
jgi:fluoride exporter